MPLEKLKQYFLVFVCHFLPTSFYKGNQKSVVATIEKGKEKEFVVTNWQFVKSNALDAASATPRPNVRNDFDIVKVRKEIDSIKGSLKNSSKVVDENGEPKDVYHGTGRAECLT